MDKNLEQILAHVSLKLQGYNLLLDEQAVIDEYERVDQEWRNVVANIAQPVNFLIIGEAPLRYETYFYNPRSTGVTFLNPAHFNCNTKPDLRNYFLQNGILVFDLYPLPLPTFIYDNVTFDRTDIAYRNALTAYYQAKLGGLTDGNTIFVIRYSKLASEKKKRGEWRIFKEAIGISEFECIGSNNIPADEIRIREVFGLV